MRIAACTVVAVLAISLDARAQPPQHAHGKALGHANGFHGHGYAYAHGHARRADFAANEFKVGLSAAGETPGPGSTVKQETPVRRPDAPAQSTSSGPAVSKGAVPDCISK
jgi:hypothetical protein